MHAIYFDENKHSKESPFFYVGGILIPDSKLDETESVLAQIQYNFFGTNILTKDTEMHGKEIFHGKANFKGRSLVRRMDLLEDVVSVITHWQLPVRIVRIDVEAHRSKHLYPTPEYRLGLQLILERFCDYLEEHHDIGYVFGDYEESEVSQSILDFSQFKALGNTPTYMGRNLGRLKDTIYFTQSHHSRFLQVADIVIYLTNRFYTQKSRPVIWHEGFGYDLWQKLQTETDFAVQSWP